MLNSIINAFLFIKKTMKRKKPKVTAYIYRCELIIWGFTTVSTLLHLFRTNRISGNSSEIATEDARPAVKMNTLRKRILAL